MREKAARPWRLRINAWTSFLPRLPPNGFGSLSSSTSSPRPWAVVGGLAVSARAEPRTTRDVDLAVAVDLLFASSGIEPEVVNGAEEIELVPGLSVPVARTGYLVALKALARNDRDRPQDLDDIRALLREATSEDVDEARDAVRLIEERGFARGRELSAELEDLLVRERR